MAYRKSLSVRNDFSASAKLTQSLSNLTSDIRHRQQSLRPKTFWGFEDGRAPAVQVKDFGANKLKEVMDISSTINWCGINGDTMQAKINSASLALGAIDSGELTLCGEVSALAEK